MAEKKLELLAGVSFGGSNSGSPDPSLVRIEFAYSLLENARASVEFLQAHEGVTHVVVAGAFSVTGLYEEAGMWSGPDLGEAIVVGEEEFVPMKTWYQISSSDAVIYRNGQIVADLRADDNTRLVCELGTAAEMEQESILVADNAPKMEM